MARLPYRALAVLALALALLTAVVPAGAAPPDPQTNGSAARALAWMRTQQQPDGGFPGFGAGSTADAVYAIVAAGDRPAAFVSGGNTPYAFLAAKATDLAKTPGGAAKVLLALYAGELGPGGVHSFGGVDLLQAITSKLDPATGHYGADVTGHALAILAQRAVGAPIDPRAVDWLVSAQGPEGGWAFGGDKSPGAADTNTTALVLQALAVSGPAANQAAVTHALAYLHGQQNADGGFPYAQSDPNGSASDANSTASVVLGLTALCQDPAGAAWTKGGHSAVAALAAFQNASGAFRYQTAQPDDNAGATYQATQALIEAPLPGLTPGGGCAFTTPAPGMPATGQPQWPLLPVGAGLALAVAGLVLRRRRA